MCTQRKEVNLDDSVIFLIVKLSFTLTLLQMTSFFRIILRKILATLAFNVFKKCLNMR